MSTGTANLSGNSLNNTLYAGAGDNSLNGSSGFDVVSYSFATSAVTVNLAVKEAQNTGGSGVDTITGIERIIGSIFDDTLIGTSGGNILTGGGGIDTLTGAGGRDVFSFIALSDMGIANGTRDTITDFVRGQDKISLSTIDANTTDLGNDAFVGFIANGTAFTTAGQLMFANGVLYGNTDNDLAADFAIQLTGITTLAASDILL